MSWPVVLFDLDGTIADSRDGVTAAIEHALRRQGITEHRPDVLASLIGPPLQDSLREIYGLPDDAIAQAIADYRDHYGQFGVRQGPAYAGMAELIRDLRSAERRLAVATTKAEPFAIELLRHLDLAAEFHAIVGATLDGGRRHKADIIGEVLRRLDLSDLGEVVMVGDRAHDIIGARAHGIDSIAVSWGYGTMDELAASCPTHIVRAVADLRRLLVGG